MNILPKKRWHVRTKENMARVRKDVKKAEDEEKAILDREILATNEARLSALRKNADSRMDTMFGVRRKEHDESEPGQSSSSGHINFFEELEMEEAKNVGDTNKEYEEEKKKEQREWDAKMGIQMKLGDDGNEGKGYWFDKIPLRRGLKEMHMIEEELKRKEKAEELKRITIEERRGQKRKRMRSSESEENSEDEKKRKNKKKEKKRKSERKEKKKKRRKNSSEDEEEMRRKEEEEKKARLDKLRDERMKRERVEQAKTQLILHPELGRKKEEEAKKNAPKYNSMFNPHLAR